MLSHCLYLSHQSGRFLMNIIPHPFPPFFQPSHLLKITPPPNMRTQPQKFLLIEGECSLNPNNWSFGEVIAQQLYLLDYFLLLRLNFFNISFSLSFLADLSVQGKASEKWSLFRGYIVQSSKNLSHHLHA